MLWEASEILGYAVRGNDDKFGSVDDLLFDDRGWTVRWAVVDTGSWLPGRKVLLPPSCFGPPVDLEVLVDLTRQQIKDSPEIATDAPVSRQMETDIYGHYGWTPYWSATMGYVPIATPVAATGVPMTPADDPTPMERRPEGDPHLRSVNEVTGYHIRATDDEIGHVEDFLLDEDGWSIRYMVVDTRNWWPGKRVVLSPEWMREVSWTDRQLHVDLTRAQVKDAPEYAPRTVVDRDFEAKLYNHYGYRPYW